ncbi:hypothetical protein GCM10011511_23890 [Puia dinghuensis]|uniref:Uncharacterized protein n=1 Tax=Puia dinghuensis TaxID=1792502 RepID=A0A8J2UCV4_9BACT|nr:hypothetical protein GCM10011511_23890 [Puia dinghuensis]
MDKRIGDGQAPGDVRMGDRARAVEAKDSPMVTEGIGVPAVGAGGVRYLLGPGSNRQKEE